MTKILLGILIGAGIAFSVLSIWEKEEQKRLDDWEDWRNKLP